VICPGSIQELGMPQIAWEKIQELGMPHIAWEKDMDRVMSACITFQPALPTHLDMPSCQPFCFLLLYIGWFHRKGLSWSGRKKFNAPYMCCKNQ